MVLAKRLCCVTVGAIAGHVCVTTSSVFADAGVFDDRYAKACGPIACYIAVRELGQDVTLEELIKDCNWSEGSTVGLHELWHVMRDVPGLAAKPVRLTPTELYTWLSETRGIAILATRKYTSEIDHAVAAIGTANGGIEFIDYPELAEIKSLSALADDWDGAAILVKRRADPRRHVLRARPVTTGLLSILVVWLVGESGTTCWRRVRRRKTRKDYK